MLPVPAENVSIKSSRLSLESARRKGGTELKQLLTKETHAHTDTRSKMRDMRMFTLYYIPADSYKTAYIIERTRTHLPGSKLHAAASRIFLERPTGRRNQWTDTQKSDCRGGGGHSCTPEGGIMLRSNMSGGTIYSGGLFLPWQFATACYNINSLHLIINACGCELLH